MKNLFVLFIIVAAGCSQIKQIGEVNMISTRNIDPNLKYQLISSYSGSKKLSKSKSTSVEAAIDQTVKDVPGGEFLMNAKIYLVDNKYIAVEGDVWGNAGEQSIKGFKVGTKVTWKNKSITSGTKYITGTITALKDNKKCIVRQDETGKSTEMEYDDLTKTN